MTRRIASAVLIALATLTAIAGGLLLYAREELVDSAAFADRALVAARQPAVARVIGREIAVQVIEPGVPDLVAARPLIESAISRLVQSGAFKPVVRLAAEHGHRLLFERHGGNAVFDIVDAGSVVSSALRTLAPQIARKLPSHPEAVLLTLRRRSFAAGTLRLADSVRTLGLVLPLLAFVAFAAAIAIAPNRRTAITACGVAVGTSGVLLAIGLFLLRRYVTSHVYGTDELSDGDVRAAAGGLWSAFLNDLLTWTLATAAVAWLLAAASSSVLAPYAPGTALERVRRFARRPLSVAARAARAAILTAVGIGVIVRPGTALRVAAVIGGALLVYVGVGELLSVSAPVQPRVRRSAPRPRRRIAAGAIAAAATIAVVLTVALTGGARNVKAGTRVTCNGYVQLCSRRLDEVVFAGTHNSMSAADTRGWLIANQDRDVEQQLRDGIRLFKISTHYAVQDSAGGVHTDLAAEGTRLNRVAAKLDPSARAALQRLSGALGSGSLAGRKRDIWLCHTLCELGATRMLDFLTGMRRFLEHDPNQVVILFDEDYVAESDIQRVFERAKLFTRLATLQPGQPLPTLGSLIRSRHNVVVFAQKPPSGKYPWNADAFATWIQDTPLGAKKTREFTCKPSRGKPANPLLMLNNWADIFPPRPGPNVALVKRSFILARARECVAQRGRLPNLILTDYYNRGDVVGAVATLNGVSGKPAP